MNFTYAFDPDWDSDGDDDVVDVIDPTESEEDDEDELYDDTDW